MHVWFSGFAKRKRRVRSAYTRVREWAYMLIENIRVTGRN